MIESMKACVFGGAIGDAMGYAIEFDRLIDLQSINDGERLSFGHIRRMGDFVVSDDTQMSLFTLSGIMNHPEAPIASIYQSYLDWGWTQLKAINTRTQITHNNTSWLLEDPRMIVSRAPGITCMNALGSGVMGTIENRINDSKGCGGVMRIAPIALYYSHDSSYSVHDIGTLCVRASAITHGHDMSMLASYHLGSLLARMVREPKKELALVVQESLDATENGFESALWLEYRDLLRNAIAASRNQEVDITNISKLGEGWIAEEAIAIAIYVALRYQDDIISAYEVAIYHDGDSDSTGSIMGNILGTYLSFEALPKAMVAALDIEDIIERLINDAP